jgi:hypothetical protein
MDHRHTKGRSRQRGAIMVEACIVIASFVLVFLAMVFFRNMYLRKIQTMRLSRATMMAYSMQGCPDNQSATQWAGVDLDPKAGQNPGKDNSTTAVPATEKTHSKRADEIMGTVPGAGSNGSALNPIGELGLTMKAAATTKSSLLGTRKGFKATMGSTSYVTCGEGIKDDSFKGIIHYALDHFKLSKDNCSGGKCNEPDAN